MISLFDTEIAEIDLNTVGRLATLYKKPLRQGALGVYQIPGEMRRGLDLLRPDYKNSKERNKRERTHSFGVWRHIAKKENGIRAHSVGFLQAPAHSTL